MRRHVPVLLREVLEVLLPRPGETVLDVTLGLGGHAAAFLERTEPGGILIGIDADAANLESARKCLQAFGGRVTFLHANFSELAATRVPAVDILFADLGLSSPHVDEPLRGFTFRAEAPLDLRFDRTRGETASEMIARSTEEDLSRILKSFGEVRQHRKIAQGLKAAAMRTTFDVRATVERIAGHRAPAILAQVFQALRIAVNDELQSLQLLLRHGPEFLRPGGRMGVISYHSLEDRQVKQAFRALTTPAKDPFTGRIATPVAFELLTKKPLVAAAEEVGQNPRARSARFRAIRRVQP